ncbi:hypothetical protein XAP412_670001 [Xanthomonas phaseoli pv. phaseoli]|uniref:Uncharacterized protein n=1 Tax=Xanthomonas campestris pv. phaseoli TaxID=317013 RepID=A0AB38E3Z0_XANCH|nr:hypothetical protein XAP6984_710050 [Xanthomonas phaseoli pv. phaseoli]SON88687.1 hypothetical protein XAP412_670001 [Xanthomonas phaseoli pv. phaseoli]SON91917.1 hypothetical protein XAP7430_680050 [Xanthomonas phaseoli pv. phaseoli]
MLDKYISPFPPALDEQASVLPRLRGKVPAGRMGAVPPDTPANIRAAPTPQPMRLRQPALGLPAHGSAA